jgi:hypothetical protein
METAVEAVTFYHWLGLKPDGSSYPSSEILHVSGGERVMGSNGAPIKTPMKEARFHNGIFQTEDPETIACLRRMCAKNGAGYTESYEEYLSHVMTPAERLKRQANQGLVAAAEAKEVLAENSRLKQKLAELEKKQPRREVPE